jgi:hypothetical protein
VTGLEPHDECPVHCGGEWPPNCERCGRFMPWNVPPGGFLSDAINEQGYEADQ